MSLVNMTARRAGVMVALLDCGPMTTRELAAKVRSERKVVRTSLLGLMEAEAVTSTRRSHDDVWSLTELGLRWLEMRIRRRGRARSYTLPAPAPAPAPVPVRRTPRDLEMDVLEAVRVEWRTVDEIAGLVGASARLAVRQLAEARLVQSVACPEDGALYRATDAGLRQLARWAA